MHDIFTEKLIELELKQTILQTMKTTQENQLHAQKGVVRW